MRNGDFRGTAIAPKDPNTGLPFPDQVIPSGRIDPAAKADHGLLLSAARIRERWRTDMVSSSSSSPRRATGSAATSESITRRARTTRCSSAEAISTVIRTASPSRPAMPSPIFRSWIPRSTRRRSSGDGPKSSLRRSSMNSGLATTMTIRRDRAPFWRPTSLPGSASRTRRASAPDRRGFPQFQFTAGTNRPTNISDAGRNVDRTLRQNAFSVSDNITWVSGGHTLKGGGLWTQNTARDGFGFGVNYRGRYRFRGTVHRQCLHGFSTGVAHRRV